MSRWKCSSLVLFQILKAQNLVFITCLKIPQPLKRLKTILRGHIQEQELVKPGQEMSRFLQLKKIET